VIQLVEYISKNGKNYFRAWLIKIPVTHAVRVRKALSRMELGNFGDHKTVGQGVMERRIFGDPALRIYYARHGEAVVLLLAGGTKHGQGKDIARAKSLWAEYKDDKPL
jgi:putative addiction module killer protein